MKHSCPTIGIDLLGGEHPPQQLLDGLITLLKEIEEPLHLVFFVTDDCIQYATRQIKKSLDSTVIKMTFHSVLETIHLDEHPIQAVKNKRDSSMHEGMLFLKNQRIDALISIGNTGALLILSKLMLSALKDISRPALLAMMPTKQHPVAVLDVGANLSCRPEQFVEFAEMGVAFQRTRGIKDPRVGILNIGSEEVKGTQEIRKAHSQIAQRAQEAPQRIPAFLGNLESHAVFEGETDVLITEGFAGNIFLKTAEATSLFLIHEIKNRLPYSNKTENHIASDLEAHFCHQAYPGALLIGCDGIVIKCHSYSDGRAIMNAIHESIRLIQEKLIEKIESHL